MSALSDVTLADVCRNVGFARPELVTAIASAIAASGAIPTYEHAIYPGPVAIYRGLWGVDLCEWPTLIAVDLSDPYEAAYAALDCTAECSGFQWCPAYRSGAYAHYVARATDASTRVAHPTQHPEPITNAVALRKLESHRLNIVDAHNAFADHAHRRF